MEKVNKDDAIKILIPVIIVIILLVAGKGFLSGIWEAIKSPFKAAGESLGISNTDAEDKAIKATTKAITASEKENTAFDPNFYKTVTNAKIFTMAESKRIGKKIFDSIGLVYDSPEDVLMSVKSCKTKTQLSFVSKIFADTYGKDLLQFLISKLDTTGQKIILGKILNYSNKLK